VYVGFSWKRWVSAREPPNSTEAAVHGKVAAERARENEHLLRAASSMSEDSGAQDGDRDGTESGQVNERWGESGTAIVSASFLSSMRRAGDSLGHGSVSGSSGEGERARLLDGPVERLERRHFLSKAFVTFKTFTAATIARQVRAPLPRPLLQL